MNKLFFLLLILLLISLSIIPNNESFSKVLEDNANNTSTFSLNSVNNGQSISSAITLPLNTTLNGATSLNMIYYNVSINVTKQYKIIASYSDNYHVSFTLEDSKDINFNYSIDIGNSNQLIVDLAKGNYTIVVSNYNEPFTIEIMPYPTLQPGETINNSIPLNLNTNLTYKFPYNIYFNFSITTSGEYNAFLTNFNKTGGISFNMWDQNGNYLGTSFIYSATSNQLPVSLTPGTYFIGVFSNYLNNNFSLDVAPYTIHPGEILNRAIALPLNTTLQGTGPYNRFYNITVPTTGTYRIETSNPLGFGPVYQLMSPSGGTLVTQSNLYQYVQEMIVNLTVGMTYTVQFYATRSPFTIKIIPYALQSGEQITNAVSLIINNPIKGSTPFNSWFNISITTGGMYYISLSDNFTFNGGITVKDKNGQIVNNTFYTSVNPLLIKVSLVPGLYTIQLSTYDQPQNTNFTLGFYNYDPSIVKSSSTKSSIISGLQLDSTVNHTITTPFSSFEVIIISLISFAIISFKRRKK